MDAVPSVSNENEAGRSGATAPYFINDTVTYVCATGYTPSAFPIQATCVAGVNPGDPPIWIPPTDADIVCRPGKTYFLYYYISFLQSEHKTNMKAA